jgi:AraC-like DNA-binding protein/mannose-6-phosphate isomerase-like protein (cupin superfamily)|tara:strand:- start:82 stop:1047 length:966 start_codon:yes stop_codon:yes gene_type:complete
VQPFRLVNSQSDKQAVAFAGTCEVITYDSAQLNVFAAELSHCQPHWHEAPELVYVLKGALSLTVHQQEVQLNTGDLAYIGPDLIHALENQHQCALLTLQFSPQLGHDSHTLPAGFGHFSAGEPAARQLAAQCLTLLELVLQPEASFFALQTRTYSLLALLEERLRQQPQIPAGTAPDSREEMVIRQSIAYINEAFAEPLTVADLAARAYLSYSHFSRLFKKVSGYSPSDYLAMVRVNHAKPLLKSMQVPITDIAERAGFAEHRAMLAAFKKYCGVTPTAYRKQYYADFEWRADDERVTATPNKPLPLSSARRMMQDSTANQ